MSSERSTSHSPGTHTNQPAIIYLGISCFSVPDFDVLSKSCLRHLYFLWKVSPKPIISFPRQDIFTIYSGCFTIKPLLTKNFGLPSFQTPRCLASCLYKQQDSTPYLLPSTYCPAAWLPLSLTASRILPNHSFPVTSAETKEKPAAVDLPPLGSTCALILLLAFAAFPVEVYGPLACSNNTPVL